MMGISDAMSHSKKCDKEGPAELSPETGPQTGNRRDSQDNWHAPERTSNSVPGRSRSNRRLRQDGKKQLQADVLIHTQKREDNNKGSCRFPQSNGTNAEAVRRQPWKRTASSSEMKARTSVGSKGGPLSLAVRETIDRIASSPSLAVECEGSVTTPIVLSFSTGRTSPVQHALHPNIAPESMSTPNRSVTRSQSDSASKISQNSTWLGLGYQPSPDSSDSSPHYEKPKRSRRKPSKCLGLEPISRRSNRRASNGSSPSTSSDETAGRRRRSMSRSSTRHDVSPPRRDRGDSAPSIPIRRTQSEISSEEESPSKQSYSGSDDRWDSDPTRSKLLILSGPSDSTSSTIISKSTIRRSPQAPRRSQSLIEGHRERATSSISLGSETPSLLAGNEVHGRQGDKLRTSFREPCSDRKLSVQSRASEVTNPVDRLHPSVDKPTKEQTRSNRFGFHAISKSFTFKSRTVDDKRTGAEVASNDCKRPSRTPSLTSMFRKGADGSTRSTTQRTVSTASTEPSTISYDSPVQLVKLENERVSTNELLFGKLFARLRDEVDKPLVIQCSGEKKVLIPTPQSPSDLTGMRGRQNGDDKVTSPCGIQYPVDQLPCAAKRKEARPMTRSHNQDEESDIESVHSISDDAISLPNPRRSVHSEWRRTVGFGTVMIREYARSVGDNPSVSCGTPIGLGWTYFEPTIVDVDFFEADVRKPGARTRKDFYLSAQKRFYLLLDDWGYSVQEIDDAKKVAAEIRKLREISMCDQESMPQYSSNMNADSQRMPRAQDRWEATPSMF